MDTIVIGTIKKPHGIKGLVSVRVETDFADTRFQVGSAVYLRCRDTLEKTTITEYGGHKQNVILGFDGVESVEAADRLRGCTLEIDPDTREPLEADAFYFDDLAGMRVLYGGTPVGTVKTVMDMPQGAMLRIERPNEKDLLVPFMKHYIKSVDKEKSAIILNEIEGLL